MIGPKLDARSYTNLILVVIALLLAINLIAQPQSKTLYTPEAEATQQVAAAVNQVAASNQQIAQALNRVADSINEIANQMAGGAMSRPAPAGSMAPSGSSDSGSSAPRYEGSIQVDQ